MILKTKFFRNSFSKNGNSSCWSIKVFPLFKDRLVNGFFITSIWCGQKKKVFPYPIIHQIMNGLLSF